MRIGEQRSEPIHINDQHYNPNMLEGKIFLFSELLRGNQNISVFVQSRSAQKNRISLSLYCRLLYLPRRLFAQLIITGRGNHLKISVKIKEIGAYDGMIGGYPFLNPVDHCAHAGGTRHSGRRIASVPRGQQHASCLLNRIRYYNVIYIRPNPGKLRFHLRNRSIYKLFRQAVDIIHIGLLQLPYNQGSRPKAHCKRKG